MAQADLTWYTNVSLNIDELLNSGAQNGTAVSCVNVTF